jgi:N-methylhydantoinase A
MRYVGQEHAVTVEIPLAVFGKRDRSDIKRLFDEMHELRYGTCAPAEPAEIVSLRSTIAGIMRKPAQAKIKRGRTAPPKAAFAGTRPVNLGERGGFRATPTYRRSGLLSGNKIKGPALIEEHASTTVLMSGDAMTVDPYGNLMIAVAGAR